MNTIFNYNKKINNFIIDRLNNQELKLYNYLVTLRNKYNSVVYAPYTTLAKAFSISTKTVQRTITKLCSYGLIVKEVVKAKTNNFRVNQYYIVQDLTLTELFQNLSKEEQQKYISVVSDAPQPQPTTPQEEHTEEQEQLFDICKNCFNIHDISFKKTQILLDIAQQNADIDKTDIVQSIKSIVLDAYSRAKTVIINKFGYAKKCLKTYTKHVTVVPTVETVAPETETETISEELKQLIDFNTRNKLNFSTKQLNALNKIASKKSVVLIDILRQVINTNLAKVKDLYKYVCGCIRNKAKQQTTQTTADTNNNCAYDSLALTGANNDYSWDKFVPFTSEDIESLCISKRAIVDTECEVDAEIEPNTVDTDNLNDVLLDAEKPIDCIEQETNADIDDQYTIKQEYSKADIRAFLDSLKHDNSTTPDNSTTDNSYSCTSVMSRLYSGVTADTKQKIYNDSIDEDNTEQLREQQLKMLFGY